MIVSATSARKPVVLLVDDDQVYQLALRQLLKSDYEVRGAYNSDEAIAILRNHSIDLVILDIQMRSPDEGLKAIPKIKELNDDVGIIVSSGLQDVSSVKEALRLGALDYLCKSSSPEELMLSISRALDKRQLIKRFAQQDFEVRSREQQIRLIGSSAAMEKLRTMIAKLQTSRSNILIYGETGTGKEVVARLLRPLHPDGTLAPFVSVDSSTIHSQTAESILFGHEKGAFTGAEKSRKGIFEEANGGIVYFDELGNMPLEIQAKLLRVLQEKEVLRLGSSRVIPLDFRVISATNRDLEVLSRSGCFKSDLLQRLNVIPIYLPPLRERPEDIAELVDYFCSLQRRSFFFSDAALECLKRYDWPGNVRELQNLVAYLEATTDLDEIDEMDLPLKFREARFVGRGDFTIPITSNDPLQQSDSLSFYERVARFEADLLREAMGSGDIPITKLAKNLQMDRTHLYTKLKAYGLFKGKLPSMSSSVMRET